MKSKLSLLEKFDRTLSGGFLKQITWLTLFTLAVLAILVVISLFFPENDQIFGLDGRLERIKGVFYHLIDPGNLSLENHNVVGIQVFTTIVAGLGMVLLSGMLITTLTNVVERRVSDVMDGNVVYHKIKDHYVIIGYGSLVVSIIRNIYSKESEIGKRILILTSQNVREARVNLLTQIPSEWEQYIHFYSGNIESDEHISNLNVDKAVEIYVLGENEEHGRDSKNIECVRQIARLRVNCDNIVTVNVQFDKLTSYSLIQKLSLPREYIAPDDKMTIYFRPFNHYENWARILWGYNGHERFSYNTLDFEPIEGDKYVHLVILGFNKMGRALLLEALRQCHYPNYDEKSGMTKSRITVVDKKMDELLPEFQSQYPYLDQIKDIKVSYLNANVEDKLIRTQLINESRNSNSLLTIAVCLSDPDASLSMGLCLPDEVFYGIKDGEIVKSNTRVLIRQSIVQKGIGQILESDQAKYSNVHIFGFADMGISYALMNDDLATYVNAFYQTKYPASADTPEGDIYAKYSAYLKANGIPVDTSFIELVTDEAHHEFMHDIAKRYWLYLSESHRFANRYQIDMFHTLYKYKCKNVILEQMEHLRWNADRSIVGYRYLSKSDVSKDTYKNKDIYKFHGDIVPYYELGVQDVEKDSDNIKNMKALIIYRQSNSSANA